MDSYDFRQLQLNQQFVAKPSESNMMMFPPSACAPLQNSAVGKHYFFVKIYEKRS